MRFAVESWAPEYGGPADAAEPEASGSPADPSPEVPPERWAPVPVEGPAPAGPVAFVDGTQRVDARVWIDSAAGESRAGLSASYAAGVVVCRDGSADVERVEVRRGLFTSAPDAEPIATRHGSYEVMAAVGETVELLVRALQQRMAELEAEIAAGVTGAGLVLLDGHLSGRQRVAGAVGYIKSHHASYLPPELNRVVAALEPGQRTPLFLLQTSLTRFSWYLRLPGASGHPWAGIARCEIGADRSPKDAADVADAVSAALPRFASQAYKDPRAPQNLTPIGGLERELRRRLGDRDLLVRALRAAAGHAAASA